MQVDLALTSLAVQDFPFLLREVASPDDGVAALFRRVFRSAPPAFPRHFVAFASTAPDGPPAGYVHFTAWQPGVFLCGGLCVDPSLYRTLTVAQRERVAGEGSLARWMSDQSIKLLGPKRAVFAYTGNTRSRRDGFALGFAPVGRHLIVQWHEEPPADRDALVEQVDALGPF